VVAQTQPWLHRIEAPTVAAHLYEHHALGDGQQALVRLRQALARLRELRRHPDGVVAAHAQVVAQALAGLDQPPLWVVTNGGAHLNKYHALGGYQRWCTASSRSNQKVCASATFVLG